MLNRPLILIIDDEKPIRRLLRSVLEDDYRLIEADSAREAIKAAEQQPPDLVLLDLGLPDTDGQELLRHLREWLTAPIIILSVRDQEGQKIEALDHGADDYLTKPFSTGELTARIRAAIRRSARTPTDTSVLTSATLKIDLNARKVTSCDRDVKLTPIEFKLLSVLMRNAGRVLTHRFLLKEVWGPNYVEETHYLRVYMATLRRKIEPDPAFPRILLTEQGVGYRLITGET